MNGAIQSLRALHPCGGTHTNLCYHAAYSILHTQTGRTSALGLDWGATLERPSGRHCCSDRGANFTHSHLHSQPPHSSSTCAYKFDWIECRSTFVFLVVVQRPLVFAEETRFRNYSMFRCSSGRPKNAHPPGHTFTVFTYKICLSHNLLHVKWSRWFGPGTVGLLSPINSKEHLIWEFGHVKMTNLLQFASAMFCLHIHFFLFSRKFLIWLTWKFTCKLCVLAVTHVDDATKFICNLKILYPLDHRHSNELFAIYRNTHNNYHP